MIESLEKKKKSVCIFLDFAKAFDTVNHQILLKKLNYYGVRGLLLKWGQIRCHNVKHNVNTSTKTGVKVVPQELGNGAAESGWMTEAAFYNWFKDVLVPQLGPNPNNIPYLLIFDGHGSHISYQLLRTAIIFAYFVCLHIVRTSYNHLMCRFSELQNLLGKEFWSSIIVKQDLKKPLYKKRSFPFINDEIIQWIV